MKLKEILFRKLATLIFGLGLASGSAQTVDTWIGPASGGEWNTDANWSTGVPPLDSTTNAFIGSGTNVNYNLPMTAASIGALTLNGVLNANASGFNCSSISMVIPTGGDRLFITNSGAAVSVTGSVTMGTNANMTLGAGASLNVGSLTVAASTSSHAGGTSVFTNNGGIYNSSSTTVNNNSGTATGLVVINGGTNNLGNTFVGRDGAGSGGFLTLGNEGLIIYNGLVTMTNLNVGNGQSGFLSSLIAGGTVTNVGTVTINQGTTRASRLLQKGGYFVVPDPGVINPNSQAAGDISIFSVTGGTNVTGGFFFGNSNSAASTVNFTNAASIYVGSQGINWNGAITLNASLNSGGIFGATADWTGSAAMRLISGSFTFDAADVDGTAHNITLSGVLSGVGGLVKTGGGALTLSAADTFTGNTYVMAGTLALGSGGSLASPNIFLGNGAILDASGAGGFTVNASQTLSGFGTVNGPVTAAPASIIYPGSNSLTGTLTFATTLTENGGANNEFNLSANPSGPNNDFINAAGGLILSGTNTITINGALTGGGVYPLISYGSSLTGDVTNFTVVGAGGILSNSPVTDIIYFIAQSSVRGPTNITWIGNATANNWDTQVTTNWLNLGTGSLDFFVSGDNALFSDLGGSNSMINIPTGVTVTPGSITINTSSNYTFTGNGAIGGTGSLTVSNGALTILTTNVYTGPTILSGGVLATPTIANSGTASGIGSASSSPDNFVFNGGTFDYFGGSTGTDHGITLTNSGGTIDVTNGTTLTLNGTLTGNGGLTLIDLGTLMLTAGNSYSGNTTISNGTLNLNNTGGVGTGAIVFAGGTLDLTVGSQPTYNNNLTVTANSTLISAGGNNNVMSGSWTGNTNVTLSVSIASGGTFTVAGNMTNFGGTVYLGASAGTFRFNGSGNTMFGDPNATFDLGTGSATLLARNNTTITLGALTGASSTFLLGQGAGSGTLIWNIGSSTNNPSTTFWGTIKDGAAVNRITSINKVGTGTLTLAGQNTYTGETTISSGTLALAYNPTNSADGSINSSATINLVSGAVLDVSGRSDDTFQLGSSVAQTLEGRGTILGALNVGALGTVAPGGGAGGNTGTLTVTNSVASSGSLWMKLNRANSPNCDQIVSTLSTITYGGTLTVTNTGARLQAGDTFTLFNGGGLSGGIFSLTNLPNYYTWDASNLGVNGSIRVAAVLPPPSIASVDYSLLSSGTITLNAINGAPNGQVVVLTSTNIALPLSSWTGVVTNNFDSSGNLSQPITVNPALPQSYYTLQAY